MFLTGLVSPSGNQIEISQKHFMSDKRRLHVSFDAFTKLIIAKLIIEK